jgi:hypothetical protein
MSRYGGITPAILLSLGCLLTAGPGALAQVVPPQAEGAPHTSVPPGAFAGTGEAFPVFAITGIEVVRTRSQPSISVIAVRGVTSAEGWEGGELIPIGNGIPPDGVLDLVFVAHPPMESAAPTSYAPIHAVLPLSADHPFHGVRVRGATNTLLLRDMQGVIEAKPPVEACSHCVGRHFVAKGGSLPAGVGADQVVRAEDLPANVRVIQAADGMADLHRDPDRLTILVGEDGRIIDTIWE